jgi:hypothetical protein
VWAALAVSAAALLLCLGLVSRRRARRPWSGDPPDAAGVAALDLGAPATTRPAPADVVVAVVGVGVVGAVLARPWVGVVAGACVLAVLLQPRTRVALRVAAPALVAVCAAYVVYKQHRDRGISALDWPSRFHRIDSVAWLAVILLLAEVVVAVVVRRAASRPGQPDDARAS